MSLNDLIKQAKSSVFPLVQYSSRALPPRALNIDVTWRCNLRCTMCSAQRVVNQRNNMHLSLRRFNHILRQVPSARHLYLMGLGEPLMNPEFLNIVRLAARNKRKVSFITNGMRLNRDIIEGLGPNVVKVSVSVDTADAHRFNRIRKGADLEKIIGNMRRLKQLKPEKKLSLLVVLMQETIADLPGVVELAADLGAEGVEVNHLISLTPELDAQRVTDRHREARNALRLAEARAQKLGISFSGRPLNPRLRHCWQPWTAPLILLNGDILPCCFMDRSDDDSATEWYAKTPLEIPFAQYRLGNIFTDRFQDIWNNAEFRAVRKAIRSSQNQSALDTNGFNAQRRLTDVDEPFAYCRICLVRWSAAC